MAFLVIAYPNLSRSDFRKIQLFRRKHDLFFHTIDPHFTIVFPVSDWNAESFTTEIVNRSKNFYSFEFCLRGATLNKDAFNDYFHVFLVPDEGNSQLIKLHDKLYSGSLLSQRALTVDFIPHIGIGNSRDPQKCLVMITQWNHKPFAISGQVCFLDVVKYEKNTVETIKRIPLKRRLK